MVVVVVILIVIPVLVSIMVMIPMVIVLQAAAITVPITRVKLLSVMVRFHPAGSRIRRARPVAFMPFIVMADGIPIATYPCEFRPRTCRHNTNDAGTRRWADPDAKRNLSLQCSRPSHHDYGEQHRCANAIPD